MSSTPDRIDALIKKLSLAKYLAWAFGAIAVALFALNAFLVSKWQNITSNFVEYCDPVLIENNTFRGFNIHQNNRTLDNDQQGSLTSVIQNKTSDRYMASSYWLLVDPKEGQC